jgi:hypothetical protein
MPEELEIDTLRGIALHRLLNDRRRRLDTRSKTRRVRKSASATRNRRQPITSSRVTVDSPTAWR